MPRRISLGLAIVLFFRLLFSEAHARSNAAYCFPATPGVSDCLAGRFDQFWRSSGGLPVFGFPITPLYDAPTREGLVLAQMVERNRLEYHPDLAPPYDILLGRLGEDLLVARGRDWRVEPVGLPKMDCWHAEETEHTVCDQEPDLGFLSFYRQHGLELGDPGVSQREALALWGLPLTEPAIETNEAGDKVLTQWFERARFEYHPGKPAEYRVLLGLLGREVWGAQARPTISYQQPPPPIGDLPRVSATPPPPPPVLETPTSEIASPTPSSTSVPELASMTPSATPAPTSTPVMPSPTRAPTEVPAPAPALEPTATPPAPAPARVPMASTVTPSPTPSAKLTPAASVEPDDDVLKQELFELVDALHQEAGCAPFVRDNLLEVAAQAHAADIAAHKRIDHVGTDGATLRERLARIGYPYNRASESIAVYKTPEIAVHFWMDEPPNGPHRQNITNCQYTDAGIGLAYDDRGWRWWVMDVASQRPGS